ncbi:hypothetical protein KR018_006522 [Drosophila ironensis]|nr:hypothetical protein KR018_006522 [Drosophila ironensis]
MAQWNKSQTSMSSIMEQVEEHAALDSAQQMLTRISDNCFRKCVDYPSGSLRPGEQRCIKVCMDRYLDSFHLVARTFSRRLEREAGLN